MLISAVNGNSENDVHDLFLRLSGRDQFIHYFFIVPYISTGDLSRWSPHSYDCENLAEETSPLPLFSQSDTSCFPGSRNSSISTRQRLLQNSHAQDSIADLRNEIARLCTAAATTATLPADDAIIGTVV